MAEEEAMAAADVNGALIYTSHRRERLQQEDGRRANNFYLLDSLGGEHLAVVGEERDTRDGHYLYRAMPPFDVLHPATWGNATGVVEWLHSLLGQSVDDASFGVAAAPMDWQPTAAGEEKAGQAQPPPPQRPKSARGLTVSGQPLDGWPPPPPPPRSQLALPAVPTVRLPEPPTQALQKSAEGIRSEATVAHAAALGGLVARAEAEAAQRSAARRAAADWLRGELPADEAELLAANITGLAETLVEISALSRQSDAASGQLPNGLHADGELGQQLVDAAQSGDAEHLCNGVVSPEQEAMQQLKLQVKRAWLVTEALDYLREVGSSYLPLRAQASAGVVPAVAAAAQHEDPAIALLAADYLSQLRTAAEAHLAVLASRKFSTDPRAALALRLPAIVATADAIVEAEAAQASAVQRAAMAAAQAARPRPPQPSPQAGPATRAPAPAAGQQTGASMDTRVDSSSAAQVPQPQDSEADAASGFRHPSSPTIGGLDGVKPTTKPRTPHHKNLLARSAAMAGRKSGGGVGTGPRPPRQPPAPTLVSADAGAAPPAALEAPAASGGAVSDGAPAASGAGSGGPSRPSTAGTSAGDANAVSQWAPAEEQAIDLLDGEPDLGPLGNALKVMSKGTGCLQACRFAEVQGMVHAITATAQEQLQRHEAWQSNAPFVRSVGDKVAGVQKEAARLSPEKAESTNRKAKQTIMKLLDALRATVEALSAKQAT